MNLAIIKHDDDYRKFLFQVPDHVYLKKGDRVICRTRRGEADGTCVYDGFTLEGPALEIFISAMGAKKPLAPIIGEYQKVMYEGDTKITNGDYIRAMSDKDLAEYLLFYVPTVFKEAMYTGVSGEYDETAEQAIKHSLDWLNLPARRDGDG